MTDEQWGHFLAECALGPLSDPPPLPVAVAAWVAIIGFILIAWLSK